MNINKHLVGAKVGDSVLINGCMKPGIIAAINDEGITVTAFHGHRSSGVEERYPWNVSTEIISGGPADRVNDTWLQRGQDIAQRVSHQQWEIGDWLVEGTKRWERKAYDAAERIFPEYNRATLQNIAYVARALKPSLRSEGLSWSHHSAVASMKPDKQKELLDYAAQKHLSFAAFRRHLNALEQQRLDAEDAENQRLDAEDEKAESEQEKQARLEQEEQWRQFSQRHAKQPRIAEHNVELAKEIIHAGKRALAKERHPDKGGSTDGMVELNLTVEWLEELIGGAA